MHTRFGLFPPPTPSRLQSIPVQVIKPMMGQFEKAKVPPKRHVNEFKVTQDAMLPIGIGSGCLAFPLSLSPDAFFLVKLLCYRLIFSLSLSLFPLVPLLFSSFTRTLYSSTHTYIHHLVDLIFLLYRHYY